MKPTALSAALFALAFAASAQTAAPATSPAPADATAIGPEAVEASTATDAPADRNCLKETGSRIAPASDRKGRKCINANGRSYDREAIDQTGSTDMREVLRKLDPAVH